mmetsp:Transcript_3152/g.8589  ORF Transcript_3152/g.8589 Transcript_3152/m.8589 type:complete len:228 (+) Transcript_3152:161-844(+)
MPRASVHRIPSPRQRPGNGRTTGWLHELNTCMPDAHHGSPVRRVTQPTTPAIVVWPRKRCGGASALCQALCLRRSRAIDPAWRLTSAEPELRERGAPCARARMSRVGAGIGAPRAARRGGEGDGHPLDEQQWLALLCDGAVHQRRVPVAFDVGGQALLIRRSPDHDALLRARDAPRAEALKALEASERIGGLQEVDESEAERVVGLEVQRQVHKVKPSSETGHVQQV